MKKILVLVGFVLFSSTCFAIEEIPSSQFEKAIASDYAVIEFFSPSCPHCIKMESIIKEVESKRSDIKFYKIDVKDQAFAQSQGITSWPTFHVYKNGKKLREVKGSMSLETFVKKLDNNLTIQDRIDELNQEAQGLVNRKKQAIDAVSQIDARLNQIDGAINALEEIK